MLLPRIDTYHGGTEALTRSNARAGNRWRMPGSKHQRDVFRAFVNLIVVVVPVPTSVGLKFNTVAIERCYLQSYDNQL